MRWRQMTNCEYVGQAEDALFPGQLRRLLVGRTIVKVECHEGSPGGHNNDQIAISLDDGWVLTIDAYSGGDIYATVVRP